MTRGLSMLALGVAIAVGLAAPAAATTVAAADFKPGSTLSVGLPGVAYDYAFGNVSLGAVLGDTTLGLTNSRIKLGARGVYRLFSLEGLSTGLVAGLMFDPGNPGERAYMVPDAGLSIAYTLPGSVPMTLRLNMTVTVNQYDRVNYENYPAEAIPPRGNVLQRLTFGPNSTLGLGLQVSKHLEFSLGGGTLVGMRLTY